jgi:hypothetical protein
MKGNHKVKHVSRMANGHKRISISPRIAGKVRLLIDGQRHYRDSLESARQLAHRIAQKILLNRQQKQGSPFRSAEDGRSWVEYRLIIEEKPFSELPEIGSLEDECRRIELAEKRSQGIIPRVIIERYPPGKRVSAYESAQAGRPETNRRKF